MARYIIIWLFFFNVFFLLHIGAQTYTVAGYVADSLTNETVIGATVMDKESTKASITDIRGYFQLSGLKNGDHTLVFSHASYNSNSINITISNKDLLLKETKISEKKIALKEVSIVAIGSKRLGDREVETSLQELPVKAILTIPSASGDIFRAIKYLPGVEGSSPFSPLVSVRGGDPSENMVMLDGITIYNPYHVVASMGTFNTNSLKEVDLLLGGFGAEFGGRNSSIINITTKEGTNNGFHGDMEPTSNHFTGFCEFPVSKKSTMTIAGRAYYPIVMNFIMNSNTWFYDLNVSYTWKINDNNKLSFKYFSARDHQIFSINSLYRYMANMFSEQVMKDAFNNLDFKTTNNWNNNAGTFQLHTIINPKITLETQIYGSFHSSENYSDFKFDLQPSDTATRIKFNYGTRFASYIEDVCLKSSVNWKLSEWNTWKLGIEANNYFFNNSAKINDYEKGAEKRSPFLLAGYMEDKIKIGFVVIRPGLRLSKYSLTKNTYAEPRVNAVIKLGDNMAFRAAYGTYYQYIISMNTSEYEMSQTLDYYYPLRNVKPALSTHYIAGFTRRLNPSLSISLDAYYKDISRIYTFNLTQSEIEVFNFSDKLQQGYGKAVGLETLLKGQYKKFSGWTSLGFSRSIRSYPQYMNGKEFLSDYDRTFSFKGVCNYQVTEKLSYSLSWLALSGHPVTIAQSQQYYCSYNPVTDELSYSPQYIADIKNNARLPMVLQIDIGFRKQLRGGFGGKLKKLLHAEESYLTGSIQNLTFLRRNIDYYFYIPSANYYIPFGMNYFPMVSVGYGIKF